MTLDLAALSRLLPPPDGRSVACKACGAQAAAAGQVSFAKSCLGPPAPDEAGAPEIQFQRCGDCGLLFTSALDAWTAEDFQAHIYNSEYVRFDPDYVEVRPGNFARDIGGGFQAAKPQIRLLDYGGGNGMMAERLRGAGYTAQAYDPFSSAFSQRPDGRFNLITCIETVEHLPRPLDGFRDMASFADDETLILFTTLLQPQDILEQGLAWWYVGPRNGHITFHTRRSLARLWHGLGYLCASFDDHLHVAFRRPPAFSHGLLKRAQLNRV